MKKTHVAMICLLLCALAQGMALGTAMAANPAGEAEAAASVNRTAFRLYGVLAPDRGNFCFSPYSISTVFAMTYAGARGETEAEMRQAFTFGENIHTSYGRLQHLLTSPPPGAGELISANSVWPQSGYRLQAPFRTTLRDDYHLVPTPLDFEKNPERARNTINEWVRDHTKERIANLLQEGSVDTGTRMVLVNAVYLKAPWLEPFKEGATEMKPFAAPDGEVQTPTMSKREFLSYAENSAMRAVRIPYRQGMFSMTILLPQEEAGMEALTSSLSPELVDEIDRSIQKRFVDLALPKFRVESDFELSAAVRALGVRSAFEPGGADFSGINGSRNLFIGTAVHQAFIEVDEGGTEAAASTAVSMVRTAMPLESTPLEFFVDRPFVFFIRDELARSILFLGRVDNPSKK